jgi:hypothetical protein
LRRVSPFFFLPVLCGRTCRGLTHTPVHTKCSTLCRQRPASPP